MELKKDRNKAQMKERKKTTGHLIEPKRDRNKAEMKERKNTTGHLQKYAADVG